MTLSMSRITIEDVEEMAAAAVEFSDGAFRLPQRGAGYDGTGWKIVPAEAPSRIAEGRYALAHALAYYVGGLLGWARYSATMMGDELTERSQALAEKYANRPGAAEWQEYGENAAESLARMRETLGEIVATQGLWKAVWGAPDAPLFDIYPSRLSVAERKGGHGVATVDASDYEPGTDRRTYLRVQLRKWIEWTGADHEKAGLA